MLDFSWHSWATWEAWFGRAWMLMKPWAVSDLGKTILASCLERKIDGSELLSIWSRILEKAPVIHTADR